MWGADGSATGTPKEVRREEEEGTFAAC